MSEVVRIADIFDLQMGKTPSRDNDAYWTNGSHNWVSIADISTFKKFTGATKEQITDVAVKETGIKIVPRNTVIMSFKLSLGKTAIVKDPIYTNEAIMAFVPKRKGEIFPDYFYYFFSGRDWDINTNQAVKGATLNKATLSSIRIKLPPLSEQRRIAAILDKVDSLIALRQQQLDKLDELVKARFVEMFGDPVTNPYGYKKKALKETCKVITGNTPSRDVVEYYGDYIEWIKTDNIVSGLTNPTSAAEYLSEKGMRVGRYVDEGAILMACIAGSIASIGRVCITNRRVAFNQQINAIIPAEYNAYFLYTLLILSKEYLVEEINMALKGILSKSKLEGKTFYVPPMEKQNAFAAFVSKVDKSKAAMQKSLDEIQLLRASLMQQYFS